MELGKHMQHLRRWNGIWDQQTSGTTMQTSRVGTEKEIAYGQDLRQTPEPGGIWLTPQQAQSGPYSKAKGKKQHQEWLRGGMWLELQKERGEKRCGNKKKKDIYWAPTSWC